MAEDEFRWHRMADERPTDEDGAYLLLGNGGGMYAGRISTLICPDGSTLFRIPNNRSGHIVSKSIKAWAEIPPFREVDDG